ncbi:MAG: DUF6132 family protein [Bacteroidales bacterium]|nr:DUF6132 family protein [Bacteroidales bacterium]
MKKFLSKNRWIILGAVLGALGGFLYWYYVGCQSSSCPIKSSPYLSTLWGMVFGALLLSFIPRKNKQDKDESKDN